MNNEIIKIENGTPILTAEVAQQIADFEKAAKQIEKKQKDLKEQIRLEMEKHGIVSIKTDVLDITYVGATKREQFRAKQFREENPTIYDAYVDITSVAPSIRIKVK